MVMPMRRLVLAVWLALFASQTAGLMAAVAPDGCVEDGRGSASDSCPDSCARCLCCARVPPLVTPLVSEISAAPLTGPALPSTNSSATSADPGGIFHVPRTR
jgi:hypothetical protein